MAFMRTNFVIAHEVLFCHLKWEPTHVQNNHQSFFESGTLDVQKTVQKITIYIGEN